MAAKIFQLLMNSTDVRDNEVKAVSLSFFFVFTLMAAYYILRPVRDSLASDWTDAEVSTTGNLAFIVRIPII